MIEQLINRMRRGINGPGPIPNAPIVPENVARQQVLESDPYDLILHMDQVRHSAITWDPQPAPPSGPARNALRANGRYIGYGPHVPMSWDHLGYSYVLENTRIIQILRRVVREYRTGEGLGIPSQATYQWLDAAEVILFGAANPLAPWLATSSIRQDPEAVRRNAYWRLFGLDLAFGTEDNRPPVYDKATAANTNFVQLFEELLFELWQAITNIRNFVGVNATDNDRIFRLAEALQYVLKTRRQERNLAREELVAATVLGWAALTLSTDTPVVVDLRANATNAAVRLRLIGERVGLPAHPRSSALFAMATDLSMFLQTIESGVVAGPGDAWLLYREPTTPPPAPQPIGEKTRRVITEWAAATGKDLKGRAKPVETTARRQLVPVA